MNKVKDWIQTNYIILLILIVASALRFYHVDYQSVWLDEICSITESNPDLNWSDFQAAILASDPHPQLYFLLLKTMFLFFGYTTFVARIFSAIIGVLGVFSIYLLGKEIANKKLGLIAASLLAINYFHIYHSQEVRMYGLLLLFTVLSYYRLVIFLKNDTFKNAVWYGIFTGLMLLTQFFGLFVLASQLFILLVVFLKLPKSGKLQFVYKSLLSGVIMILLFIPAINIFIETTKKKYTSIPPTTIDTIKQIFKDFAKKSDALLIMAIALITLYFFFVIKKKLFKSKEQSLTILVLLSWIFITLSLPIIRSYLVTPMIISRYFITILPPILILIALGIDRIKNNVLKISVLLIFCLVSFYELIFHDDYYNSISKTQFREVSEYVIKENHEKNPVVSNLSWYLIYFLTKDQSNIPIIDRVFEDYVQEMMKDPEMIESFWYFGAAGNPLKLSEKSNNFLEENFDVVHSLDKFDSWTKHYRLKKAQSFEAYKDSTGNIILSNINDGNWAGGVSTNNTILLVDFSEKRIEELKKAVRLKSKNGKIYKIIKTEQVGDYIYVYIDKSPFSNKEFLKFPNHIEFLK